MFDFPLSQGPDCPYRHGKVYDDQERGFSDSSTKRGRSEQELAQEVLSVIREAQGAVYNYDVFERWAK